MENKQIDADVSISGKIIFDSEHQKKGRLLYVRTSGHLVAVSLASLLLINFIFEDLRGRDIQVNGVYAGEFANAALGKDVQTTPLIKACDILLPTKKSGKLIRFF